MDRTEAAFGIGAAFAGKIGTEPELKRSPAGKPWTVFDVAVGLDDETQWVRVGAFGDTAEHLVGLVTKGDIIYVEGTLRLNEWTDHEGKIRGLMITATRLVCGPDRS
jgi:single-stranded DNA-binding protein